MPDSSSDIYADENTPQVTETSKIIHVLRMPHVNISVRVDCTGLANLYRYVWFGQNGPVPFDLTDNEVWDYLIEWELVELRRIGPEDSEYFATDKLLAATPGFINPKLQGEVTK